MGGTRGAGSLPEGAVTLLLADIEESTPLWERQPEGMRAAVDEAEGLVEELVGKHHGARPREQGEGDSFVAAFGRPSDGLACAQDLRRQLAVLGADGGVTLRYRMALHLGEVDQRDDGTYTGTALARCARVRDLAHGGQVLVTNALHELVADALPAGVALHHHGVVHLKGLSRSERVYEVLDDACDRARPLRPGASPASHLPGEVGAFIGRGEELTSLAALVTTNALVTLTGAGGSGKTRLALRLAHQLEDSYREGARWVDMAGLRDPAVVSSTVAAATQAGPLSGEDPIGDLASALANRELLLVIDNCEHLIDGVAKLVAVLQRACSEVTVVATSREALAVEGEATFAVPSLPVPAPAAAVDDIARADAVRMLVDRANRVRAGFALDDDNAAAIAGICRRLDGMPLGLELAAARLRVLSPEQILDGLADRFRLLTGGSRTALPRQRTLEASVEWSYDLLAEDERAVLRRLSVFASGFTLPAAEVVCSGGDIDRYAVLDLITRLTDRSLIQVEVVGSEARYSLLETIRAYARQRLAADDDATAARNRHLDHFNSVLLPLDRWTVAPDPGPTLARLAHDLDNIRAALDWAVESAQVNAALGMLLNSSGFWQARDLHAEMHWRLATTLEEPGLDDVLRAQAGGAVAYFAAMAGDFPTGARLAGEALTVARRAGDGQTLSFALLVWAVTASITAAASSDEALAAVSEARRLGDVLELPFEQYLADFYEMVIKEWRCSEEEAQDLFRRCLESSRALDAPQFVAIAHAYHANYCVVRGRYDDACEHARRAREFGEGILVGVFTSVASTALVLADARRGRLEAARGELERMRQEELGAWVGDTELERLPPERQGWVDESEIDIELGYRAGDPDVRATAERALPTLHALGIAPRTASGLVFAGTLALEAGDRDAAGALYAEAEALSRRGNHLPVLGAALLGQAYAALRDGEHEQAWRLAHEALGATHVTTRTGAVAALETVAGLAADRGMADLGARLLGAAQRVVDEIGYVRLPIEERQRAQAVDAARDALGDAAYEAAHAEGLGLSLDTAVSLAQRGRGSRSRPVSGWNSLTAAEVDVARLVAEGLTNAAAAERLFVSVNTVKAHLTHAYAKLGVSSRVELAAEVARRPM